MATNSKDFNKNTSASAQHILKQINFKFLCLLHFWDSILGQIDKVNLSLQNQNQSIDVATKSLEGLIECIQNIQDSGFENALNEAKKNALLINIPTDFPTTRKIKRKINDLELNETKTNETSETIVKLQCYQSLDSIITSLKWRFEKLSNISSNFSFLCGRNLSSMEIDDIKKWSDDLALLYSVDLNGGELFTEVQSFKFQASTLISSFKTATSYDFLKCIHQHSLQDPSSTQQTKLSPSTLAKPRYPVDTAERTPLIKRARRMATTAKKINPQDITLQASEAPSTTTTHSKQITYAQALSPTKSYPGPVQPLNKINSNLIDILNHAIHQISTASNFKDTILNDRSTPSGQRSAGGTAILVANKLIHYEMPIHTDSLENTTIHIQINNRETRLSAIYKRPQNALLTQDIQNLLDTGLPTILAGDLNAKHPVWNSQRTNTADLVLLNHMEENNYLVVAPDTPTHHPDQRHHQPDVLDIAILKNINLQYQLCNFTDELSSDHSPVILTLHGKPLADPPKPTRTITNWPKFAVQLHVAISSPNPSINSISELDQEIRDFTTMAQEVLSKNTSELNKQPNQTASNGN
ncbi:hypothetical protein ACI65C_004906 [Semiaphis heraclei]